MENARALIAPFALHGGRLDLARATFPNTADWIDLSTGISPWAFPAAVDACSLQRLPEPAALAALEAAAAATFGTDPVATIAVPGSDIGLRLIARLLAAKSPAVLGPGYSGHLAMWANPHRITKITAGVHDALVLARPNNPDGAIADCDQLAATAADLATRNGWLIVDEAFADPDASLAAKRWPNLVVLRSFGKFFGLAGLRLGFVITPPPLASALRRLLGDWPVSGPAITIATAAYLDRDWHAAQHDRLTNAAARLDALLTASGLAIAGGTTCFRLVETPDAPALFRHLAHHAILTRPFADNAHRLRIGLPASPAAATRLCHALQTHRP